MCVSLARSLQWPCWHVLLYVQEVVFDKGVIFIASAGNAGPGLTTCGAPGGTSECVISIGAFVSPALAAAGHAARDDALPAGWAGQQYNWSSRGASLRKIA